MVIVPSSIISYFYSKEMSPKIAQDKKVVDYSEVEISSNGSSKFHDFVLKLLEEIELTKQQEEKKVLSIL